MKLYTNPISPNSRKAMAVVEHTGLDVDVEIVDVVAGATHTPEYYAINPNGMVPTLVDGELKLWESNAIMSYLATKAESDLWPRTEQRYDIMRWMYWQLAHFGPAADALTWENMLKKVVTGQGPDPAAVEAAEKKFRRFGAVLNGQLEGREFVSGGSLTLADFALAAVLTFAPVAGHPVGEFTHMQAWLERIEALPAWLKTAPPRG